jgi:hypothetical protein
LTENVLARDVSCRLKKDRRMRRRDMTMVRRDRRMKRRSHEAAKGDALFYVVEIGVILPEDALGYRPFRL